MIVGVIGSGSIGPDLAYGFATALAKAGGSRVLLMDVKPEALDAGMARLRGYAKKAVERGKMAQKAADAILATLQPTLRIQDLADAEFVLEAATEHLPLKRAILADLEGVVRPDCLIGFATSGLPRAQIAAGARHPERCFVNHPFFPAWRSLPVEVALSGDAALGARMMATLKRLGKVPIITADVACFAADDVFCNFIAEAARIVEEGVATPAQVDRIVDDAVGGGGPFNVMDLTRGNGLVVHCQELMRDAPTGTPWLEPPRILRERGARPWHDRAHPGDPSHDAELARRVADRVLAVMFARTYFVVDNGICDASDFNWMLSQALGFRQGTLDLAEEMGAARVHELCAAYAAGHPGFVVPPSIAARQLPFFRRDVVVERDGDVAVVRVRRPEVKNALRARTVQEVGAAIAALDRDPALAGIVLTSFDGAFAGADIGELAALPTPDACAATASRGQSVLSTIAATSKPVVAALDGPVLGGGAELAMACHARVVGKSLLMGQPEVALGIIPGYGGTQRLPRLVGVARALEMMRTGKPVGAADACKMGWAHGEPVDDPLAAAKALVRRHARGEVKLAPVDPAPLAVPADLPSVDIGHHSRAVDAILVDVVRRGLGKPLPVGLAVEADGFGRCRATQDMSIGMRNFIDNGPRKPAPFVHT